MKRVLQFFLLLICCFQLSPSLADDKPVVSVGSHTLTESDFKPTEEELASLQEDPMGAERRELQNFTKIVEFVEHHFVRDYAANNNLTAAPEFVASFKKAFGSESLNGEKLDELAEFAALQFAVDAHLYKTHGGRVVFDHSHPMLPIEAYFNAYKAYSEKQQLVFFDKEIANTWWLGFVRPNAVEIPAGGVDFSVPWWHKLG